MLLKETMQPPKINIPNLFIGLLLPSIEEKISVPSIVAIEIITDVTPVPARIQAIVFLDNPVWLIVALG